MRFFLNDEHLYLPGGKVFTLSAPPTILKDASGEPVLDTAGAPRLSPQPPLDVSVCGWMEHLIDTLPQGCGLTTKQWGWAYRTLGVCAKAQVGEVVAMEDADYDGFLSLMYDDAIGEVIAARFDKPWKGAFAPNYLRVGAIALYQILEQAAREEPKPLIAEAPLLDNGATDVDSLHGATL